MRSVGLAAALVTAPAAASAETLIVTWDQNPDPNVTAYRVFIGTAAGRYSETYDVPGIQTSFVYPGAVPGRRYYVSVAAQVDYGTWGPRSAEISGTATAARQPDLSPQALRAPAATSGRLTSAPARGSSTDAAGVQVIATDLQPVSALAVSRGGVGLLVEGKHVVRAFDSRGQGLQPTPALALDDTEQIQDITLDSAFDRTGRVFLAVSRTGRDGDREVSIEQHRLLGGSLGESMAVVPVLDGTLSAGTLLAATRDGRVVVAQAGLVRVFAGTSMTSLGEGPPNPVSVAWDDATQSAWLTGTAAGGAAVIERLSGSAAQQEVMPLPAVLANVAAFAHSSASGRVAVAGASTAGLIQFDPATGDATMHTADLAAYGAPVLLTAPAGDDPSWYVVLRADRPGGSTSDTVVRITAGSGATQPIH